MGSPIQPIYLKDYQAPAYRVVSAHLSFELGQPDTRVRAVLHCERTEGVPSQAPLVLDGQNLELESIYLDGKTLGAHEYQLDKETLILPQVPPSFILETCVRIQPHLNTELTGLYLSSGQYCTQCESHGFRRITYFIDRPDNLSLFTVRIEADKAAYPNLLSNGNCKQRYDLPNGRHGVVWEDPFKKPAYLFALVAGDFYCETDAFTTQSGRKVDLQVYVEKHNAGRGQFALHALKQSMAWDERVYGREYDLDVYMIVAVSDFNMGAMENKGLNIFNDKYVLADPQVATDTDYQHILQVVAHEYFHNWSGNRVTLRDWFQLSLKEGFTVFRDQSFSEDETSPGIRRIEMMLGLKTHQFKEDSSPLSHPVRPSSYIEMNNFYTATVYEKGAEIIRMLHTLLGPELFRKGTDLYFEKFDGQAATVDDFVACMAAVSSRDLSQFKKWYDQSGTPILSVQFEQDEKNKKIILKFAQKTLPTADQSEKVALHIPIRIALINIESGEVFSEQLIELQSENKIVEISYQDSARLLPSILRQFSAPVELKVDYTPDECFFLALRDNDPCARYEAFMQMCLHEYRQARENECYDGRSERLKLFFASLLQAESHDYEALAYFLSVPGLSFFAERSKNIDVDNLVRWHENLIVFLANAHKHIFEHYYLALETDAADLSQQAIGKRALRSKCLHYLIKTEDPKFYEYAQKQFEKRANMTETIAALSALKSQTSPIREQCFAEFYQQWKHQPLVIDKWYALQAQDNSMNAMEKISALSVHESFTYKNPNRVYSLFAVFGQQNFKELHRLDGKGYDFIKAAVLTLDGINPQVAARIIKPLINYQKFDQRRCEKMRNALIEISKSETISKDVFEIVSKSL